MLAIAVTVNIHTNSISLYLHDHTVRRVWLLPFSRCGLIGGGLTQAGVPRHRRMKRFASMRSLLNQRSQTRQQRPTDPELNCVVPVPKLSVAGSLETRQGCQEKSWIIREGKSQTEAARRQGGILVTFSCPRDTRLQWSPSGG